MREAFRDALLRRAHERTVVLTADVGFDVLEPLAGCLGDRFINAGVAEQNMIGVAAGLAARGFEVWVYGIASFTYARAFEQLRNDLGFLGHAVRVVGNGGGYGYGVMGPTHHALDDYGTLLAIPDFAVYVPAFASDIDALVARAAASAVPCYLRLARAEADEPTAPPFAAWRRLCAGVETSVITIGPLAASYARAFERLAPERRPSLWSVGELPLGTLPPELLAEIAQGRSVLVAEEHVAQGGLAMQVAYACARAGANIARFETAQARHRFDRYGSQAWLRARDGLDAARIVERCVG